MDSSTDTAQPMITSDENEDCNVLRPIFCELSVNNRPDGSAMLTQG